MSMRGPGGRGGHFLSEEEKKNAPKITKELLFRIFSYLKPYWKQMIIVLAAIIVSSVLNLYPSILTGKMIDEGLIAGDLNRLIFLIIMSFVLTLTANLIGVLESYMNTWIAQHITYDMRNQMYQHLQNMSHRFYKENNQGDIITRMTSDIDGVKEIITNTFSSILSNSITLTAAFIAMVNKNWILALLSLVLLPLFSLPTRAAGKTRWSLTKESQESRDRINGILNETLSVSGQLLVKLFGMEKFEYRRYERENRKMINLNIRESMAGRWFRVVLSTFSSIGPLMIYLVGGIMIMKYNSDLSVGDITVMVALLSRMYGPVNQLMNMQADWIRSMALFTRLFDYYDMPEEITNAPDAVIPDHVEGNIRFNDVCFGYEPGKLILKHVDFELKSGRSIAIVGPSGSGKSTMINLIPRLYDVTSGSVTFDGIDVRKLDLSFLRSHIGVVSQDTYLFSGTIRENLMYANIHAKEEDMIEACKKASIHDFIMKQEAGYDTQVGNRGLKLSGGEKQRISIARVLLKNPSVMIFDEATASLDSISEKAIQDAIDPLISSRTSILIAHRLSTILAADEILVVKDGQIIERGTHQELVGKGGTYTELYETQFKIGDHLTEEKEEPKLQLLT